MPPALVVSGGVLPSNNTGCRHRHAEADPEAGMTMHQRPFCWMNRFNITPPPTVVSFETRSLLNIVVESAAGLLAALQSGSPAWGCRPEP